MATKTKAELEQEIKDNHNQIAALKQEIKDNHNQIAALKQELEKVNRIENKNQSATELYEIYQSYVTAGFTEEQAWELTKILINNATTKRGLF